MTEPEAGLAWAVDVVEHLVADTSLDRDFIERFREPPETASCWD